MSKEASAINQINRWKLDPRSFVIELFGHEEGFLISPQQEEGLECYRRILTSKLKRQYKQPMSQQEKEDAEKIGIVIHSGHGTGKTAFAAWVLLHFMVTRAYCKIPCVAPVGPQLKSNLWPEVHLWLRKSPVLREMIQWQAEKIYLKDAQGKEWFAFPRTVNVKAGAEEQAETLAGIHADSMLVIVDEGSGVPDPVFRPLEGGLTGPVNFCLMIGNPTQAQGFFIDAFTKFRKDWMSLHWNAEESPLVQPSQIERMARKYGKSSNAYRIRVLGLPPTASPDTLIPWDWVMQAVKREIPIDPLMPMVLGIDVGRELGGDDSVICSRRGSVVRPLSTFNGVDTQELAYWCLKEIADTEAACVAIDVIGWGAGTYDVLRNLAPCAVLPVNVSEKASDEDMFYRLRDELWWNMRERFQAGTISLPEDDELVGELSAIKYNFSKSAKEKVKVESKLELRERGIASPNKADALVLSEYAASFAGPRVRQPNVRGPRRDSVWVG
jgi:phage terminase large subunit